MRSDGRDLTDLRPIKIEPNFLQYPEGSCLIEVGRTRVICTASFQDQVPPWLEHANQGWVTAEYAMIPRATHTRTSRQGYGGKVSGRTQEIQRLIGRSLRGIVDLKKLVGKSVVVDCDVIQADGGTRTASISGAYVALALAFKRLIKRGDLASNPIQDAVAAVSVGIKRGELFLDLVYEEDSKADVDMNVVMTGDGRLLEIQGTAEHEPFTVEETSKMISLAEAGIKEIFALQAKAIEEGSR
jgi:ribonuclease PH